MRHFFSATILLLAAAAGAVAAEPAVLVEDTFDGRLADGWHWLRENPDTWRLKDGALEIRVEPGKAATVRNALVRTAPDRATKKYAVEVTVTFTAPPTVQYEQGGITWYQKEKPVFKLVHEHIDGSEWIIPGRIAAPSKTVQLRLLVEGTKWTAQFREDAKGEFRTAASGKLPEPGDDRISLQCYDGPEKEDHWIRFDDFRIVELP